MKIAVIAHPLRAGGGISVGRNLIAALGAVAPDNGYLVSIPAGLGYEEVVSNIPNCQALIFLNSGSPWKRWRYEQNTLLPEVCSFAPDLVLGLAGTGLAGVSCPQAILYHTSHLWYPSHHYGSCNLKSTLKIYLLRRLLRMYMGNPRNILLHQTMTARKRIIEYFGINPASVHCPNAISKFSVRLAAEDQMPVAMRPHRQAFRLFYLTRYYPHKNLEALVDAFIKFPADFSDSVLFITIAPDHGKDAKRLLQKIEMHGLKEKIINVGPLPQEELGAWFRHSDALVMPTLLESFSGTYLEAMHFETPILTSNLDFAHEICGDAALYFDPWDVSSIKDAILCIKNDGSLRSDLIQKGKKRLASGFKGNWDDIARHILNELELLVSKDRLATQTINKGDAHE